MIGIEEDPKDWQRGFDAGREDKPFVYPSDVEDLFAWTSGYIEGRKNALGQTAGEGRKDSRDNPKPATTESLTRSSVLSSSGSMLSKRNGR
jgi:hypothetical protein